MAACGPRVFAWSMAMGVAYGLVAGVVTTLEFDLDLKGFGGRDYIPQVFVLAALRAWGPAGAAMVTALTTVVVLHRAGKRIPQPGDGRVDPRLPFFAGAAACLLYPVVVMAGCVAAPVTLGTRPTASAADFVAGFVHALPRDVAYGIVATAVAAVVLALGSSAAGPLLGSRRWGLLPKLFVVWIAVSVVSFAVGLLGPWFA